MSSPVAAHTAIRRFVPPPPPKTPKSAGTRVRLLEVATALFIERGYAAVSMRDIASAAKLTKGAVYGHFRSKGQLFVEVIRWKIAERDHAPGFSEATADFERGIGLMYAEDRRDIRLLEVDAAAAARHDPDVAAGLANLYGERDRADPRRDGRCTRPRRRGVARRRPVGGNRHEGVDRAAAARRRPTPRHARRGTERTRMNTDATKDTMITVDTRSRFVNDAVSLDPVTFVDEHVPALPEARGVDAGRGAARLGLAPLTLNVEGEPLTFCVEGERLVVERKADDALVVGLDRAAFSDLVQDVASTFGLQMSGRAKVEGGLDGFLEWEPVLRCFLDGRPVYEPGSIALLDRVGAPLDLHRSFSLDDDPSAVGHFLAEAGYLHLEGVFTEAEMAAVSAELDAAIAAAERDDGASWWARTSEGEWYPARILGFNQQSPTLRELCRSDRFRSIPSFTDDNFVQRDPDVGDSAEGLLKKIGVVEGMSDVSWHKDCSLGGHSRGCSSLTVGISVTGAGRENGELGVVAGSRRANVPVLGVDGLDLPPRAASHPDRRRHRALLVHAAHEPAAGLRRATRRVHGLRPRAPTGRPTGRARPRRDPPSTRRARRQLGTPEGEPERPGRELRARLTYITHRTDPSNRTDGGKRWNGTDGPLCAARRRRWWVSCSRARWCCRAAS